MPISVGDFRRMAWPVAMAMQLRLATVILALVATALFQLFSGSLQNASVAGEYSRAILVAESRLSSIANETTLREGAQQGTTDDGVYRWSATVAPYVRPASNPDFDRSAEALPLRLWQIGVTVSWVGTAKSDRTIALSTLRLATKE